MDEKKIKRTDERDIIFARMNYKKGTPVYDDYYHRNPHKKKNDEDFRAMPELGGEGTATHDPINSPIVDAAFRFLADIKKYSEKKSTVSDFLKSWICISSHVSFSMGSAALPRCLFP
ncbi:MAG: hypothetical protein WCS98_09450 [Bacillota bacterium]|jgi:hypothetical protein|nr:hypothetical protein [Bacillota bacterium]MDD3298950.1 hypothetical protein [Bacillota bacterium]MDD3851709.1 hypothetical protein [Bacillota bacterium]MDD4708067.1 hypothetical protein [Bacillota bacterium]